MIPTLIFILFVFLFDQGSKWLVLQHMEPGSTIPVVGHFIQFTHVQNFAGAMGMDFLSMNTLTVLSLATLVILIVYWVRIAGNPGLLKWVLAGIIGGAMGNISDRMIHGSVVDFIDVDIPNIHIQPFQMAGFHFAGFHLDRWWVFNVADSFIFIGMFFLFYLSWRESNRIDHSTEQHSPDSLNP